MALEIKGLQRVFKFKKDSKELVLSDPNNDFFLFVLFSFFFLIFF